jgi:hypothetical protein
LKEGINTNLVSNRYRKPFQATEFKKGYLMINEKIQIENDFTVSSWVNLASDKQYNTLVSFSEDEGKNSIWIGFSRLSFHVEINTLKMTSTNPLQMNIWTHVTFVLKNNIGYMYLNGYFINKNQLAAIQYAEKKLNFIGKDAHNSSLYMSEAIYEDLKIYKGALTSDEIKAEFNEDG